MRLSLLGIALFVWTCWSIPGWNAPVMADERLEFFEKNIRPLLMEHCSKCHGDQKPEGGLRMVSRETLVAGGDSGAAIVEGKADESLLVRAVGYLDDIKMPPKGKLPQADIDRLKQWVTMGAPWTPNSPLAVSSETAPPSTFQVTPKQSQWWSFQPIRDPAPPAVQNAAWPRNEIDRFILADIERHELVPTAEADRRMWLRRATFDLTGLPPKPEDIDAFVADASDSAYERVIDRLLESSAYGQRWARHWLDIVRYADYHDGEPKTRNPVCEPLEAWRYRDWVVESFNRDLPYDQFLTHQIAGDLLPSPDGKQPYADGLVATGFLVNGSWDRGDADKEKMLSDMIDDQIDTIGKAFMGLTIGCSRCHDHKFDPISNRDYYALAGIFYSTRIMKELGAKGGEITLQRRPLVPDDIVAARDQKVKELADVNQKLGELDKKNPKPPDDDPERVQLVSQRDTLQREMPPEYPVALAVSEGAVPGGLFSGVQDVPIHIRGSYTRLGEVVPRAMPVFFQGPQQPALKDGSGRREVAAWVISPSNPLTARVIVNRVWQWHFGQGLVATPNNFGLLSQPPSHPELLDYLAKRFVEDGWSLKQLHRRIMLSATYRQGSVVSQEVFDRDPENKWLARFVPRRLEAEALRDAMLSVSGQLDPSERGPASDNLSIRRRSLYVQTARWDRSNYATLFDAANPDASVETRTISTVAPQALFLLNNKFIGEQAGQFAERLRRSIADDAPDVTALRIVSAYRLAFGRFPTDEERRIATKVVAEGNAASPQGGWTDLAHILLCSNEFTYLD